MKLPFIKAFITASAVALVFICGCSDDSSTSATNSNASSSTAIVVDQASWVLTVDDQQYTIGLDGTVKDASGQVVGTADLTDPENVTVVATDQSILAQNVNLNELAVVSATVITGPAWVFSADQNYVIYTDGSVTSADGTLVGTIDFDTQTITALDGTVLFTGVNVYELSVYQANVETSTSSSSVESVSSSSTEVVSTESSSSSAETDTSGITITYVSGGASGSGYATRYWDCCKPHCAWPDKGGLQARACDVSGNYISDDNETSICDGGTAATCLSQIPIIVNDTLAYAFAATPSDGDNCGKCFDLVFTGEGKYSTDSNHKKIKGKHLIVISSNIGYDVSGGQFDVMIPGGGYGIFDGCSSSMGWGDQGQQYGGLLSDCETESNYTASKYKSCLTEKCNDSFSSDSTALEGCLFLANWMEAAGNPLLTYQEVECPQELLDKF